MKQWVDARIEGLQAPKVDDKVVVTVDGATLPGRITEVREYAGLPPVVRVSWGGTATSFSVDARGVGHDKVWR